MLTFGYLDRFRATLRLWLLTFPVGRWSECRKTAGMLLDAVEKDPSLVEKILKGTHGK